MAALSAAIQFLVLLCADLGLGPSRHALLVAADIAQMMKDIGAHELTPEMIAKGPKKKPPKPQKPKPMDPVELLSKEAGLNVNDEMAKQIRASPEKVKEAEAETIASATALAMYRQVRCSGCKVVADLLSADLVGSWRPHWTEESFLDHVQAFCGSAAFPGEYQVMVRNESITAEEEVVYTIRKSKEQKPLSPHSATALGRICREHVDERDSKVVKEASTAMARAAREVGDNAKLLETLAQKPTPSGGLRHTLEMVLCKRVCNKGKRRRAASEDNLEL